MRRASSAAPWNRTVEESLTPLSCPRINPRANERVWMRRENCPQIKVSQASSSLGLITRISAFVTGLGPKDSWMTICGAHGCVCSDQLWAK